MEKVVVVGAGQAGSSLCAKLRSLGHQGPISLIGEEPAYPYERPPLSKRFLLGDVDRERLLLRPEAFYQTHQIDVVTGTKVQSIDRSRKAVVVDGRSISYDKLALTTGAVARQLPASIGGDLSGVHVIRTLSDIDKIRPKFVKDTRIIIIGGGYIGLEAASVASKCGMAVTLLEMADRILSRTAAPEVSKYFGELHREHGVDVRENTGLRRLLGEDSVTGAELSDGSILPADIVVVGIGVYPATELAEAAGLDTDNGIKVDETCRTSDPDIFAAGDCASFEFQGRRIRLECVQNAIDQAEHAAAAITGVTTPYEPTPWFWSDQFERKLQIAGLHHGFDRLVTRRGERDVSFWYFRGEDLLAVDAVDQPRSFMVAKRLLQLGKTAPASSVADLTFDLKSLLNS